MAISLSDIAVLLTALAGSDGLDPRATAETPLQKDVKDYAQALRERFSERVKIGTWNEKSAGKGLRIGLVKEAWEVPTLNAEVAEVVRKAAHRFSSLGAEVKEISIPLHASGPAIWTAATRLTSMGDYSLTNRTLPLLSYPMPHLEPPPVNNDWLEIMSTYNPAVPNVLFCSDYLSAKYPPSAAAKAMMHVHQLQAAYDAALENLDVLITPSNPTVAPKHPKPRFGVMERIRLAAGNTANLCPFNATGHPALSMPAGWASAPTELGKLPVGMQLISRRWDEETLLFVASVWEFGGRGLDL